MILIFCNGGGGWTSPCDGSLLTFVDMFTSSLVYSWDSAVEIWTLVSYSVYRSKAVCKYKHLGSWIYSVKSVNFWGNSIIKTYLGFPLACNDMGWCRPPSAWSQMGTRTPPRVWAHGETGGQASATLGSRWREEDLFCGKPVAGRPGIVEWSHTCWAALGSWGLSPGPPWHPSSSSAFWPVHLLLFRPIFLPRPPASSQAGVWLLDLWRRRD